MWGGCGMGVEASGRCVVIVSVGPTLARADEFTQAAGDALEAVAM